MTHFRTCPLCEATCGLAISTRGREVTGVRGDADDVFSHGFLCPKAYALKDLDADPDRLRTPLVRRGGKLDPVGWDEAFAEVERGLTAVTAAHGRQAVGAYLGNPNAHNLSGMLYVPVLLRALGTRNVFSASTVDQMPKQVSAGLMFGTILSIPVPDIDRTDYLLMLGANPLASNGSLLTAPDMKGRLRRLRERGGRLVVVDPRRSRTADEADEHVFIRPGTDAHLLFAMVHTLFEDGLTAPGRLTPHLAGVDDVRTSARDFAPERVADVCGVSAATIRRLAYELAAAPRAAVYGRIGTCTQEFGTLASWLIDVLNVLTGNLDREGGAMFTKAAAGSRTAHGPGGRGRGVQFGRWRSRVRGLPEVYGELPVVCLAEEIETPGDGQIRALVTVAGNPALSTPNGARLADALAALEFMVSVDIYLNETTRHAHVVLPAPSTLTNGHYDLALYNLAIRNVAHYSPPLFPLDDGELEEWRILLRLTAIAGGQGAQADVDALDDFVIGQLVHREVAASGSPLAGRDPETILAALASRRGPERILDLLLRSGPYGDHFGANPSGLSVALLEDHPHGVDLGALTPRVPEVLRTPSGKIELAPPSVVADVARLRTALVRANGHMVLVGRRHLRSNNSWMHNLDVLVKGRPTCTLQLHPTDALRLGLADGETARVASRVGTVDAPVELTEAIMPGVVSLPHGWGHDQPGAAMRVARTHAGVNSNLLADETAFDPLSGNAVLNGIPVTITRPAGREG
ncbi:MAG: molybdopterin-dependent oxidoreductase [Deltaproteobacteria bacterium]|nr:molybdopterin-dependent oxidoreductase [Deltaproteobacteria bacterium]